MQAKLTAKMGYLWTCLIVFLSTFVTIFYWYQKRKHSYWSLRNIPGPAPWPLFGNVRETMLMEPDKSYLNMSRQFGKIYGIYVGLEPTLTVAEPDLIKQMMVKDFDKFVNRRLPILHDKIGDESLFQLEDDKWKAVRSITSPTFTSGKLRGMQRLMNRTVEKLIKYLDKVTIENNESINVKEVMGGFTMDTIALSAFATETDSNGDRSVKSPFLENAQKFFDMSIAKIILIVLFPQCVLQWFNITMMLSQKTFGYFVKISKEILKERIENRYDSLTKRNDFVQLLLDASIDEKELANLDYAKLAASADTEDSEETPIFKSNFPGSSKKIPKRKLTENELVAQCILFMLAGYETTASTLAYLVYELALNQSIQQRLCDEVSESLENVYDDEDSKEFYKKVINEIPYLEAVIKETLRKYPPLTVVERRAGVDGFQLGPVKLYKDQVVEVPIYAVHHSEEYYPEPERFDPERFMPENKDRLVPYTYLPFGVGPRNCIGMRFAYQEIKLLLAQIITRFRFEPTPETPIPLQFNKGKGFLTVKSIPIKISRRRQE